MDFEQWVAWAREEEGIAFVVLGHSSGKQIALVVKGTSTKNYFKLAKDIAFSFTPRGSAFLVGLDVLSRDFDSIKAKRIGVITNHTAKDRKGVFIIDLLPDLGSEIGAIFAPEHGLTGKKEPGTALKDATFKGIPVKSLYGKRKKPAVEDLKRLDILIYDIQDVACRFYTYVSTMLMCLEQTSKAKLPFFVLDRPCLRGGSCVEGPPLDPSLRSFVGYVPVPASYAMTPGELAKMALGERWIDVTENVLTVVPLENWRRGKTNLYQPDFVPPSPNLPNYQSVLAYPGTCLLEATNVNEGRGTFFPFTTLGAPYIIGADLSKALNRSGFIKGAVFTPTRFVPRSIKGMVKKPKYQGICCEGVALTVVDPARFRPFRTALYLLNRIGSFYPKDFCFKVEAFQKLSGSKDLHLRILSAEDPDRMLLPYRESLKNFLEKRERYLLYSF